MEAILTTISVSIISNGVVLGLFVWVFKKIFEHYVNRRVEIFKKEIELINQKNFYQFSRLYDEQAAIIQEVYSNLVYMSDQVGYLIFHYKLLEEHPDLFAQYRIPKEGDPVKWERYLKATLTEKKEDVKASDLSKKVASDLSEFRKKRIYFSREVADQIERLMNLILFISSEFENVTYRDPYCFEPVVAEELIKTWGKAAKVASELLPHLEELFRKHIGIPQLNA